MMLPPDTPEGIISRRGAVNAALESGNPELAKYIAGEYLADRRTPPYLAKAIKNIIKGSQRHGK